MCLANYELSILASGTLSPYYTYEESLGLISHEIRESCSGRERITMLFVTRGIAKFLPVST